MIPIGSSNISWNHTNDRLFNKAIHSAFIRQDIFFCIYIQICFIRFFLTYQNRPNRQLFYTTVNECRKIERH